MLMMNLKFFLMIQMNLMDNSFSLINTQESFTSVKIIPFLNYPYTADCKEVFLTALRTSYIDYQKFSSHKKILN